MTDVPVLPDDPDADDRLRDLLRTVDCDAAPVDRAALESIRRQLFGGKSATPQSSPPLPTEGPGVRADRSTSRPTVAGSHSPSAGKSSMFTKLAAVSIAAASCLALWFASLFGPGGEGIALGDLLKPISTAETVHLELNRGDEAREIWIQRSGVVRSQQSPTRYEIIRGSRLWRIDEDENTVVSEDSPIFTAAGDAINLFDVVGLDMAATTLTNVRSGGKEMYDGVECDVFTTTVEQDEQELALSWYADPQSNRLRGIVARDKGLPPNGPPVMEVRLLAVDEPVDESLFVVAESLSEDGRIGKVLQAQGIVNLKPVMNSRWTPLARQMLIRPGDWLRTDVRGANAALAAMTTEVQLTVGPASLVEFISPNEARLHYGQVQIHSSGELAEPFLLRGPGEAQVEVTAEGKQIIRVAQDETLVAVAEPPIWLQGFEGTTSNESIGSLIVEVDGANVPLTVGYHHVAVEIRDQIVRTTIEQSFVNHTDTRLEGVFHFPLPQDASISGFGMWIGNELVEADVVEKQRAREIYETILRERRDPGLLEWTGGNIFKARVFPIEPNSEKRIKIVYTQVLPLRGNRYRYSYALNSELMRTSPLRELSIDVLCYSDLPLLKVECSSHTVRSEMTAHSAHVEFSAQEYSPDRDFELTFELDERQSDVVVIPHRRGDDGYFLIQLMPPSAGGNWQREVLPDGEPMNLLVLCDTSASMDSTKREQQREFVASLLSSLTEDDHFRLAACDVEAVWCVETATSSTEESREQVANFLAARKSLGWTDLDRAFEAVKQAVAQDPGTVAGGSPLQVIYVGDGIVSAGDTDPAGFAQRVKLLFGDDSPVTFHSVSVGSSYESVALKGIASIGSGSMRAIGGDMTPAIVAFELLNEIAQPGLRDVKLTFDGIRAAAVYPETLPNVAAGTQQIIVGRYLPEGVDQRGEVIITGTLNGEPVRYAAQVTLPNEEAGNSFIPRLWARAHLDFLMTQGSSPFIRDQIISLSEEFHIITPYTSLLVLESDADRERFGVIRRYEMRDGEEFFAEGRDNASYELLQQQMRRAGDWRIELRRQILAQLAGLGRDPEVFQQYSPYDYGYAVETLFGRQAGGFGGGGGFGGRMESDRWTTNGPMSGPYGGGMPYDMPLGDLSRGLSDESWGRPINESLSSLSESTRGGDLNFPSGPEAAATSMTAANRPMEQAERYDRMEDKRAAWDSELDMLYDFNGDDLSSLAAEPFGGLGMAGEGRRRNLSLMSRQQDAQGWGYRDEGSYRAYYEQPDYFGWIDSIFPALGFAAEPSTEAPAQADWPAEVRAITDTLNHVAALHAIEGGVLLRSIVDSRDPVWDRDTGHSESIELYSPTAWLSRPDGIGPARIINWCDGEQRGVYSATLGLGRVRESVESDWTSKRIGAGGFGDAPLHETLSYMKAKLVSNENGQAVIEFQYESPATQGFRYTIDTEKHVVIKTESLDSGNVTSTTTYENHVEVAGIWWPTRIVNLDADGQETSTTMQEVTALTADEFSARLAVEFSGTQEPVAEADGRTNVIGRAQVLFLELPLLEVEAAKLAVADGSADWNDHLTVMLHFMQTQQWDEVRERLASIDTLEADKPGLVWMHVPLWQYTASNADVLRLLTEQANLLVNQPRVDEWSLVEHIRSVAYPITSWPEYGVLIELMKPIYQRQPEFIDAKFQYDQHWLSVLQNRSQTEAALELERQLAEQAPWDLYRQTTYANSLANSGRHEEAYVWLDALLEREQPFQSYELQNVYNTYDNLLSGQGHYDRLVTVIEKWIERQPTEAGYDPYQRLLGALIMSDQIDRAHELVREWVIAGRVEGKISTEVQVKLDAAIYFMLGQAHHLNWYRIDARWLPLLKETVEFHLTRPDSFAVANMIMSSGQFTDTDEYNALQRLAFDTLLEEAATRDVGQLQTMLSWVQSGYAGFELSLDEWRNLAALLRTRWEGEADVNVKYSLSEMLAGIYSSRLSEEYLPFLRLRLELADEDHKATYHSAVFEALITQKWSAEIETELFSMLPDLQAPPRFLPWEVIAADDVSRQESLTTQLLAQLHALHRVVDRMIEARVQAASEAYQAEGNPEDETRPNVAAKQAEFLSAARDGVLMSLTHAASIWSTVEEVRPDGAPMTIILATLSEWGEIEAVYLQVVLGQQLDLAVMHCWSILGDEPPRLAEPPKDANEPPQTLMTPIEWTQEVLAGVRRHRALMTLLNLAARRSADPALAGKVLAYLDAGIAHHQSDERLWKSLKYNVLVALDRPDELVAALTQWIGEEEFTAPWRLALGKLYAERGQMEDAIQLYEAVEDRDELGPAEYRMLSDWYQVVDRRDDYERARVDSLMVMDEWTLQQFIQNDVYTWQNSTGPRGNYVEDDVLFALKALFEKTSSPGSYAYLAQQLYDVSSDFRVLEILPDSVLGRTPQQVYPYLESIRSVLEVVRKEATSDKMLETVTRLREGELTTIDLRALDLIEAMIERRASEVLNQPGPHITASVAAMQRAFDREWGEGERRQMADFLYNLGQISQTELNEERLREMRELAAASDATTDDGFWIAFRLSRVLCDYENRMDEGLARFASAIDTYSQAHPEGWPSHMNDPLAQYLSLLQGQSRFSTAETLLNAFLETPLNDGQRYWLREQLDELFLSALSQGGQVSIGSGQTLYANLRDRVIGELDTPDHNHRANLIYRLMRVYRAAYDKRMPNVGADLETFAFENFPEVLKGQTNNYSGLIQNVAQYVHDIINVRTALKFLVFRMEEYPQRYEFSWENAWSQHCWNLARWRMEVGDDNLGDIEPPLLELVLKELRRDLLSREQRGREMFAVNYYNPHFWGKHVEDYRRVAEEVYEERRHSGRSVKHIAEYVYNGLPDHARGVEMLFTALDEGILDENGQVTLVSWLFQDSRYGEAIPLCQALMEKRPERIDYRTQLMRAYYHAGRPQQLRELLAATDEYFHKPGLWTEGNAAALANECAYCQLSAEAIEYFKFAIAEHQRTQPNQGIGGGTLSYYYYGLAQAHSNLGHTAEAVDAASGAIVSWSADDSNRADAINRLNQVLANAQDLDQFVADYDARTQVEDSAIIRKAIGLAYMGRENFAEAARHLEIALELGSFDGDLYDQLLACYDRLERSEQAIDLLLARLDYERHNFALYTQLANRLASDPAAVERAYTSIVEASPNEAENHQALAQVREGQGNWTAAVEEWEEVAALRALEPHGLYGLIHAQIQAGRLTDARESLETLSETEWNGRFEDEVRNKVDELRRELEMAMQ